jgi:hypothetical protein
LAEDAENCSNSALGGTWVKGGGLPSADPDNVATGGATDVQCGEGGGEGGEEGGEEGWHGADNSSWQPTFLFLLVFLSAVCPAGVR